MDQRKVLKVFSTMGGAQQQDIRSAFYRSHISGYMADVKQNYFLWCYMFMDHKNPCFNVCRSIYISIIFLYVQIYIVIYFCYNFNLNLTPNCL